MSGIAASLTTMGLEEAIAKLGRVAGFDMAELADDAGAILESSSRGRFDTKEAPDGSDWPAWSEAYDDTREDHHSLLVNEGDLRDSIASYASASEVEIGANLVYAAHQHFGGEETGSNIAPRPYLGVSSEDEIDLRDLVTGKLEGAMS